MSQTFTYIDPAGNAAQYTVYEEDQRKQFYWSTDHGDRGLASSYEKAQGFARNAIKTSMAQRRRAGHSDPR